MKKLVSAFLAAVLVTSLVGCGSTSSSSSSSDSGSSTSSSTDSTASTTSSTDSSKDSTKDSAADSSAASSTDGTTKTTSNGSYNISVILKTTSSEYWSYVVAGAEDYMKDNPNVTVTVTGPPSETSYDEQQNMIETAMNNNDIDGYVIAPLQSDMVASMISGQKKPIIAVDTAIEAPEVLSFVGTGNESASALGGAAAVKLAKKRGWKDINCIEICGVQGDATNEARKAGYKKGVEQEGGTFLDSEVQYANAVADQAVTCMEAIIQNHPEGVAIICANNDDMAMAAARAAKGNDAYKDTVFLGFDGIQSACESILNGEETMSVCQQGYQMGYNSVEACVKAIEGEKLESFIDAGATIVDPDTAQDRLDELKGYLKK